jgi:hypothetical protein
LSRRWRWPLGALVPGALVSCSLTGVVDFETGQCNSDQHCREVLNPGLGVDTECATYRCEASGCVRIEGEVCDGEDNDCDLVIDEPEDDEVVLTVESELLAPAAVGVTSASWATSPDFGDWVYLADGNGSNSVVLASEDGNPEAIGLYRQKETLGDYSASENELTELEAGCFTATGGAVDACDMTDFVVAVGGEHAFFAQVGRQGCSSGEIRVGVIDRADPTQLINRGRGERDPTYRGVATRGSACTDSGTPACAEAKVSGDAVIQACGASRPALAAADDQALVAYVGQQLSDEVECPSADASVFALGLHRDSGVHNGTFIWSNPTGDGEPDVIGHTRGGAAPAVAALADVGFLVAFPNQAGEVTLSYVPRQEDPPANSGLQCTKDPADPTCDERGNLSTEPLRGIRDLGAWPNAGDADGVRLAVLPLADERVAVGLSWVDGCARRDGDFGRKTAFARVLQLSLTGEDGPEIDFEGEVIELGETTRIPLLVPTTEPFFVSGFERSDRTVGDDRGGFLALTHHTELTIQRLAAFDGELVDEDELITLASTGEVYLAPGPDGEVATYRAADSELRRISLACED